MRIRGRRLFRRRSPARIGSHPTGGPNMAAAPLPPASAYVPAPEPAPLSEGARIIDTFIAPSKTLTDLRRNANWWGPWLLISIFALIFVYSIDRQVGFEQVSNNAVAHLYQEHPR